MAYSYQQATNNLSVNTEDYRIPVGRPYLDAVQFTKDSWHMIAKSA